MSADPTQVPILWGHVFEWLRRIEDKVDAGQKQDNEIQVSLVRQDAILESTQRDVKELRVDLTALRQDRDKDRASYAADRLADGPALRTASGVRIATLTTLSSLLAAVFTALAGWFTGWFGKGSPH